MIADYVGLARKEIAKEVSDLFKSKEEASLQLKHANERKCHYKSKYRS